MSLEVGEYACVCVYVYARVCACACERETNRDRQRQTETKRSRCNSDVSNLCIIIFPGWKNPEFSLLLPRSAFIEMKRQIWNKGEDARRLAHAETISLSENDDISITTCSINESAYLRFLSTTEFKFRRGL